MEEKKQAFEQIERSLKKVDTEAKHVLQQIRVFEKCNQSEEACAKVASKEEQKFSTPE